jgi:hypothetical protein
LVLPWDFSWKKTGVVGKSGVGEIRCQLIFSRG